MSKKNSEALPHSKESEMMVLGCMLNSGYALDVGCTELDSFDFYFSEHKPIFSSLKSLHRGNKPADIHLVCEELKNKKKFKAAGGVEFLTTLAQFAGTSGNIDEYCSILKSKSYARRTINLFLDAQMDLLEGSATPAKLSERVHQKLSELDKKYTDLDNVALGEILSGKKSRVDPVSLIERIKVRKEYYQKHNKPFFTGIPTGFVDLDQQVTLLENTHLVVIAGRPGMGKTACALSIANNICLNQNLPIGFFSLEMGADQIAERIFSLRTKLPGEQIKRGQLTEGEFTAIQKEDKCLRKANFFIHDQGISSVHQVVAKARHLKEEEDIRLLIIDYLQLLGIEGSADSRQYEVAEVSRTLKQLAMELNIPVLCVAQLSRKVEERTNKRPVMSDLRDSGQIEQDADLILFLHRKSYYDPEDNSKKAEIIIAKNRHGPTPSINVYFEDSCGAFENFREEDSQHLLESIRY